MPERVIVAEELASLFSVLAHPHRILILEELRHTERDVSDLQDVLGISHSRVSQHLSVLKAHKLLDVRKEGRHKYYRLSRNGICDWILGGLGYIEGELVNTEDIHSAVMRVREIWSEPDQNTKENDT